MMFFHKDINCKITAINSNISNTYTKDQINKAFQKAASDSIIPFEKGTMASNNSSVTEVKLRYVRYGNILLLVFTGVIKSMSMWTKYTIWTLPNGWKAVESSYTPLWQEGGTCQITLICDGGYNTPYLYSGGLNIANSYASGSMLVILG